jgi:hypothetical protein
VPVVDADTVVASIMAGSWPEKLQHLLLGRQQQQQQSADDALQQDQQQQQQQLRGKKKRKSAAAEAAGGTAHHHQQQQQLLQRSPAGSSKRARLSTPQPQLPLQLPHASPKQQQQQQHLPIRSPQQQQQPAAAGALQVVGFSWLSSSSSTGSAAAAAAASPRSAAGLRTYQQGFTLQLQQVGHSYGNAASPSAAAAAAGSQTVQREVCCGDFVLFAPATGEAAPRVVQLASLWQEVPSDGVVRMLARGRRFYRYGFLGFANVPLTAVGFNAFIPRVV